MLTLTEKKVANAIYWKYRPSTLVMAPNYTPRGWYECDVYALTSAGYSVEFEIKLTAADFRADESKRRDCFSDGAWHSDTKHRRLGARDVLGPSRFWFVMLAGMVPMTEIPEWAGLLHVIQRGSWLKVVSVRPAPVLHRQKTDAQKTRRLIHSRLYHRYWKSRSRT